MSTNWDDFAETYESKFEPMTGFILDRYLSFVEPGPDVLVADVGCGPGLVAMACANAGARVLALDLSTAMIERLRARSEAAGVGDLVEGFVGDAAVLPFDDDQCDAAVSNFGVIFCPDIQRGLRELARVTKPSGKLMIGAWTVEARNGWPTLLPADYSATLGFSVKPREMFRWASGAELGAALTEAGWADVTIETVQAEPTVVSSADNLEEVLDTPASRAALSDLTQAQVQALLALLIAHARQRFGDGPVALPREAWLAQGRAT